MEGLMPLHPPLEGLSRAAREAAERQRARGGAAAEEGERLPWPRAALVLGGVSLLLWAVIAHVALRAAG